MRVTARDRSLTVRAIAGSYVVLLGMHLPRSACRGLRGFAIHRTDHNTSEAVWLRALKTFAATDPGFLPGFAYPTNEHPIQGFTWSDFTAVPGHRYTYRVVALKGTPQALTPFREVHLDVRTESESGGHHDIFFNSGAAASQAYVRLFGTTRPPPDNPDDPRWTWLSRGAMEAIEAFVGRAKDASWSLRVAAYEFRLPQFASLLRDAHSRRVDVEVLYDGADNPPDNGSVFPKDENEATARAERIKSLCTERLTKPSNKRPPIAHNKFIVLSRNGSPQAVLTGSANFSIGGVFGQSNVIHIVEDASVAQDYLDYWDMLAANPDHDNLRDTLSHWNGALRGTVPAAGTTTIFSPQRTLEALEWYAELAMDARDALFMTFAFGMNDAFKEVYRNSTAPLRYALMDKLILPGIRRAQRPAALAEMRQLRFDVANRFAVGNVVQTGAFDRWLRETLTGLNSHVRFIHTKFMLIDPLSDDPMVVTGSANFSDASTRRNDENMLVIRGNTRVADVYLGEYMRLWNHYAFREWLTSRRRPTQPTFRHLDTTDGWWGAYFGRTARSRQRAYFSGT